MPSIASVTARRYSIRGGNPTIEVDVALTDGTLGRAAVPSGASTRHAGSRQARARDGDKNGIAAWAYRP